MVPNKTFIADSYSCRLGKGTHRALNRLRSFASWVSDGNRRSCFVLKCDVRKFFANIDHEILFSILTRYIPDADMRMCRRLGETKNEWSVSSYLGLLKHGNTFKLQKLIQERYS